MEPSIRIFIAYSHEDQELVDQLVQILNKGRMMVLYSKKLSAGEVFTEEIKQFIEHSHVFMPVLTESALARGWVHQEIGYAMGLHIPILPVTTLDVTKGGMLDSIQAIKLSKDEKILRKQLNIDSVKGLLHRKNLSALYQRAVRPEQRTLLIKEYAEHVSNLKKFGVVRQKGGLSSFHIPSEYIGHQVWTDRYVPEHRSDQHKELQRAERIALQNHAAKEGCRLIINPSSYANIGRSVLSMTTRLKTLIDFLEHMANSKTVVAIQNSQTKIESLTMVGDWFLAESVSYKDGDGYTHTFFTRNASEISNRIQDFEAELSDLLMKLSWTEGNSRDMAVECLKNLIKELQ